MTNYLFNRQLLATESKIYEEIMRNKKFWKRFIVTIPLLAVMIFGLVNSAAASDFRGGDTITIEADEVIDDDLFLGGNRIEFNGTVKGDLFASGQDVIINGTVEGSLFVSGQTLVVNSDVDGSLYSGGYALTMGPNAAIGRNVYFGGYSLTADAGSHIGRDLTAGGYQLILNGDVANDVEIGSVALELNGNIGGDLTAEVSSPDQDIAPFMSDFPGAVAPIDPGFRQGNNADITGVVDVQETIRERVGELDPAPGSGVVFGVGQAIARRIGEFVALLIVGGLLLYYWPAAIQRARREAESRPLPSAGYGLLTTIAFVLGVPIAFAIVFVLAALGGLVTFGQLFGDILGLGGAILGLIIVVFGIVFTLVTKAVITYLSGRWLLARFSEADPSFSRDFAALALGAFIYEILRAVPILGWFVALAAILVGLGAIYFALRSTEETVIADKAVPAIA